MSRTDALHNAIALLQRMDLAGVKGGETPTFAAMLKTLHEMLVELREAEAK